ncbi:hypothetical protein LG296_20085 (plasmid) [Ureibacillus chungkukjangi]
MKLGLFSYKSGSLFNCDGGSVLAYQIHTGGLLFSTLMFINLFIIFMIIGSIGYKKNREKQLLKKMIKEKEYLEAEKKYMYNMKVFALNKDIAVLSSSFGEATRHYGIKYKQSPHITDKDSVTGKYFNIEDYEVFIDDSEQNLKSVKELIDSREITSSQIFHSGYLITSLKELNERILAKSTLEAAQSEAEELEKIKKEESEWREIWIKIYEQYEVPFRFLPSLKPAVNALKEDIASKGTLHNSKYHVVLLDNLAEGRLKRGEFLCTQSEKLNLETTPIEPEYHVINCKKCLDILKRWKK